MATFKRDHRKVYGYDPYNSVMACVVWANVLEVLYQDITLDQMPWVELDAEGLPVHPDHLQEGPSGPQYGDDWYFSGEGG